MTKTKVKRWVRKIVELNISHLEIGMTAIHPDTGKEVKIVDGQYWGEHGLSNFWYWREVFPDGSLSEKKECGYGWEPSEGKQ